VAPGNGGTALDKRLQNVPLTDPEVLADFVEREGVAFTVVGPERRWRRDRRRVPRPRPAHLRPDQGRRPAGISKDFAKAFMQRHGIPTADYETFSDAAGATPTSTRRARPSSSRPTAWPPARAWWWR
jgi:phosphoribosylamine--glycine ligase